MRLIQRLFGRHSIKDPLLKIDIDDARLANEGVMGGVRLWYTSDGDGIGLYYFAMPPDLPAGRSSMEDFRAAYRSTVNVEVIEIQVGRAAGVPFVRTIAKIPQPETGTTYVGSLTIAFRDCSYVLKIQCEERGITGTREATLMAQGLSAGEITTDDAGGIGGDWAPDDQRHDRNFPGHPLTRCRAGLHLIESSLTVAEELTALPTFELPDDACGQIKSEE